MDNGKNHSNLITLQGVIIPSEWDSKGHVTGIALATYDEDEYYIQEDKNAKKLHMKLGNGVEVSGYMTELDGKKIVTVIHYRDKDPRQP